MIKEMTDKEFKKLKEKLEKKMIEVANLQKQYHDQTGRDYVMPLYI